MQGTFAGGEQAKVGQSRIESLKLGDWTVQNLPVMTLPFGQLSAGLGVKRIDGVIGTTLFYHFLATLDCPHGPRGLRGDLHPQADRAPEPFRRPVPARDLIASRVPI